MPGMAGVANSRRRADVNPRRPTSLPYGSQLFLEENTTNSEKSIFGITYHNSLKNICQRPQ
jgi:hypothetical protein